jgi:hypothetical protein
MHASRGEGIQLQSNQLTSSTVVLNENKAEYDRRIRLCAGTLVAPKVSQDKALHSRPQRGAIEHGRRPEAPSIQ